ncbi:kinase-like domain-containing protein [Thermoascus aurantiacus ATCC 26904]
MPFVCGKKLLPSAPRSFPSSGFELVDPSEEVEEETLPTYRAEKHYPVHIGEVFDNRYQVIAKLGYGVTSTVWLCRDLFESKYVVLKVYVSGVVEDRNHELDVYDRINSVETNHPGKSFIRKLLGHFYVQGPHGDRYICLVHQPLGLSVDQFLDFFPGRAPSLEDLKPCLRQILLTLDFLHAGARIIHTELLLPADDPQIFAAIEEAEIEEPSPRKVLEGGRTIYTTRILPPSNGLPLLGDFGEARFGEGEHDEDIMPNVHRAPEVVLKMSRDIVCSRTLFNGKNSDIIFDDRVHIAEMIAILGPPPVEFLNEAGSVPYSGMKTVCSWKGLAPIPDITLEKLAADIRGEDKDGPTAEELLFDEWLMKGLDFNKPKQSTVDEIVP